MATLKSQLVPIQITPGVQPNTDRTPLSTPHYTYTQAVRFWRGVPQKIGGWVQYLFEYGQVISGIARTLFSAVLSNVTASIIGTNSYLYAFYNQILTNITPLDTATTTIANSISTDFATLGSNPILTQNGTGTLVIADTNASHYQVNDFYTLSGAIGFNGILSGSINTKQTIIAIGTNTVTINVVGTANASSSGGGGSVVRATGLITFAATANAQQNGWRVKISGASASGGLTTGNINAEFILRNVTTNTFQVMSAGTATSHVTAAGGGSTIFQSQIASGPINQSLGFGYGVGPYGAGLYGTSKTAVAGQIFPRIWFADRFGADMVMTPGNQGPIYVWDGDIDVAPVLVENAPTDVNYIFVSNNILVTFGHENVSNQIFSSDIANITIWTASSSNQVFQDVIYGADQLISSVPVTGINLIFTQSQTYTFSYIGLPLIWSIQLIDNSVGIIGPMARCSVNNTALWMGQNNFYYWSGGNVTIIPSNTQPQCTALNYVFNNLNRSQAYKCFAFYNEIFNEVWFHYPSASSNECDSIARISLDDMTWSVDKMDRTCAEYPDNLFLVPRLISSESILYNHETGTDDDTNPLTFTLASNLRFAGKNTGLVSGFIPDSLQTGTINVNLISYQWPQTTSTPTYNTTFPVADDGARENIQIGGRYWQYTWSGSELGQSWVMGSWNELGQPSSPN